MKSKRFFKLSASGTSLNFLKMIFCFMTTGLIYIVLPVVPEEKKFFDKSLNISNNIIRTYYQNNMQMFLTDYSFYLDAKRHGIVFDRTMIIQYLKTFFADDNNEFSQTKLNKFCNENHILNGEVFYYCKIKLAADLYRKLIYQVQLPKDNSVVKTLNSHYHIINYGKSYILNKEKMIKNNHYKIPIINDIDKKNFFTYQYKKKAYLFTEQPKISGVIYELKTKSFFRENIIKTLYINEETEENILVNKCLFLFPNQIIKFQNSFYMGKVTNIIPAKFKSKLSAEELEAHILSFKINEDLFKISQQLTYDFNNKKIDANILETYADSEETIVDNQISASELLVTEEGCAFSFVNGNHQLVVFVCEKRTKKLIKEYNTVKSEDIIRSLLSEIIHIFMNK